MPLATITNGAPFSTRLPRQQRVQAESAGAVALLVFARAACSRSNRSAQLISPLTRAKTAFWEAAAALCALVFDTSG